MYRSQCTCAVLCFLAGPIAKKVLHVDHRHLCVIDDECVCNC